MYTKELLEKTKITKDALRHYNDFGLLEPSVNPINNYKIYSTQDVETVLFIKKAKQIGFSLTEIKTILKQIQSATCKHQSLIPHLQEHLEDIDAKIKTLKKMKKHISFLIKDYEKIDCEVSPTKLDM